MMKRTLLNKTFLVNGKAVRIIVRRRWEPPIVVWGDTRISPSSWQGRVDIDGEIAIWQFSIGPVRQIEVRIDAEGDYCTLINWR